MASARRDLARIALRSTVWTTLGSYANQLVGFVGGLLLTRLLAPDVFGFISLATFWVGLLSIRGKLGLSYSAVRQPATTGALLGTYFTLDMAAALATNMLVMAVAVFLAVTNPAQQTVALAMLAMTLTESITALAGPAAIALERELQVSRVMLATLFGSLLAYSVAIGLAIAGAGVWSILVINLIVYTVSLAATYWLCMRRLPDTFKFEFSFDVSLARTLLAYGLATGVAMAIGGFAATFDNYLVGTYVNETTLGFYDRAYRIASWPNLALGMIIGRVGFLTMAKVKDDAPRLAHTVRLSFWFLLAFGTPLAIALSFTAPEVVHVLYGSRYTQSGPLLRFLALSNFAWMFVSIAFWLAVALGNRRFNLGVSTTQAALLVLVGTPLTMAYGVYGTMIGVGVSMATAMVASCTYALRRTGLGLLEVFGAPAAAAVVTVAVLAALATTGVWAESGELVRVILGWGLAYVVFLAVIFLLRARETIDRVRYLAGAWRKPS